MKYWFYILIYFLKNPAEFLCIHWTHFLVFFSVWMGVTKHDLDLPVAHYLVLVLNLISLINKHDIITEVSLTFIATIHNYELTWETTKVCQTKFSLQSIMMRSIFKLTRLDPWSRRLDWLKSVSSHSIIF